MENYCVRQYAKEISSQIRGLEICDIERNQYSLDEFKGYDFIPVFKNGALLGVYKVTDAETIDINAIALNTKLLLNSNCSIQEVLRVIDEEGYVILIDEDHQYSIITESDFLKQPFRVFLFNLLSNFEMIITNRIRMLCGGEGFSVIEKGVGLNHKKIKRINQDYEIGIESNNYIDKFECMYLLEKLICIKSLRSSDIVSQVFASIADYDNFSTDTNNLRNNISHAKTKFFEYKSNRFKAILNQIELFQKNILI